MISFHMFRKAPCLLLALQTGLKVVHRVVSQVMSPVILAAVVSLLSLSFLKASCPDAGSDTCGIQTEKENCLTFSADCCALQKWGRGSKEGSFCVPSLSVAVPSQLPRLT